MENEPVSAELFLSVIKAQTALFLELLIKVHALIHLAQDRGVSDADLARALVDAQSEERLQRIAAMLSENPDSLSIQEILDQFEGPIQ